MNDPMPPFLQSGDMGGVSFDPTRAFFPRTNDLDFDNLDFGFAGGDVVLDPTSSNFDLNGMATTTTHTPLTLNDDHLSWFFNDDLSSLSDAEPLSAAVINTGNAEALHAPSSSSSSSSSFVDDLSGSGSGLDITSANPGALDSDEGLFAGDLDSDLDTFDFDAFVYWGDDGA